MNNCVIKLFFDVNLSKVLVSELLDFYKTDYPNFQAKHLTEFTKKDAKDPDWVPLLARESGEWIVISADRGFHSKHSQKLPIICRNYKIRHILFTATLLNRGLMAHKQAMVSCWLDVVRFTGTPPGSCAIMGGNSGPDLNKISFRISHLAEPPEPKSELF